jgi:ABC-2 type transport system ATP-binding protein
VTSSSRDAISARNLAKSFGAVHAVRSCTFAARYGRVTGLLGPNGAGKSTTIRMVLGLVRPSAGEALVAGRPFEHLEHPGRVVGATFEMSGFYPGVTARTCLAIVGAAVGVGRRRAAEVLEEVGLSDVARRPVRKMSLGMRQRLQIAMALLADPPILIFDEPTNGLDPEGIVWFRSLVRQAAADGRAVLIASHVLAEVEQTVDDVVVIADGVVKAAAAVADLVRGDGSTVEVVCEGPGTLEDALRRHGAVVERRADRLLVSGCEPADIVAIADEVAVRVDGVGRRHRTLEEAYIDAIGHSPGR